MRTFFLALVFTVLLIETSPSAAQTKFPPLTSTMGYSEVLTLWGAPSTKEVHEVKRMDVWRYSGAKALFKEGKVFAWSVGSDPVTPALSSKELEIKREKEAAEKERSTPTPSGEGGVDDLLTEILKDVPSSEDGTSAPSAPNMPGGFAVPPPVTIDGD